MELNLTSYPVQDSQLCSKILKSCGSIHPNPEIGKGNDCAAPYKLFRSYLKTKEFFC